MATQTTLPPARIGMNPRRQVTSRGERRAEVAHDESPTDKEIPKFTQTDSAKRNQLVLELVPLVRHVAMQVRKRLPGHVELDDLISAGILGLIDAIQKFDPNKHVKVSSYATFRIRGAILDDLRAMDSVPRTLRTMNRKAERAHSDLETRLERAPSDHEMARALGMSLGLWHRTVWELSPTAIDWLRPFASAATPHSTPVSLDSLPADNEGHQFLSCYHHEQKESLSRALERIPVREQLIIELYYREELTMREIGEQLGLHDSRISQLRSSALKRLRKYVKAYDCGIRGNNPQGSSESGRQ